MQIHSHIYQQLCLSQLPIEKGERLNYLVIDKCHFWAVVSLLFIASYVLFPQNAHNLYHTVHKCAIHWKHITLKRKQERGGSVRVRTVGGSGNGRIEGSSGAPAVSRKLVQKSAPLPEPIASASPLARGKVR